MRYFIVSVFPGNITLFINSPMLKFITQNFIYHFFVEWTKSQIFFFHFLYIF